MEDLGGAAPKKRGSAAPKTDGGIGDGGDGGSSMRDVTAPRDMLTPMLRTSLTKQGYKLIGSHSGVKMCRWTKSMLRGRCACVRGRGS